MKKNIIIETGRGEPVIIATDADVAAIFEATTETAAKLIFEWGKRLSLIKKLYSDRSIECSLYVGRYKERRVLEEDKAPSDASLERELKNNDEYQLMRAEVGRLEAAIEEVVAAKEALLFHAKTLIK